jgi:hypothetical protein
MVAHRAASRARFHAQGGVVRTVSALDDRYELINAAWGETDLPARIFDTPDWEFGHQLLVDWFDGRLGMPIGREARPYHHDTWGLLVHIMSHILSPIRGHCVEHVAIEEEGTRLILAWWNAR